jgi:hypothetical protein
VYSELEGRLFLYVPTNVAGHYDNDDVLSEIARIAFPSCHRELIESGNCLACGLWTASVFHAMRAAEIGVKVMGKSLGVTFPDKPVDLAEWQQILNSIGHLEKPVAARLLEMIR